MKTFNKSTTKPSLSSPSWECWKMTVLRWNELWSEMIMGNYICKSCPFCQKKVKWKNLRKYQMIIQQTFDFSKLNLLPTNMYYKVPLLYHIYLYMSGLNTRVACESCPQQVWSHVDSYNRRNIQALLRTTD